MIKNIILLFSLLVVHNVVPNKAAESPQKAKDVLPVVLWHGMGDTCCFSFSMGLIKHIIEREINGTYVKSLEYAENIMEDYRSGFFIHPDEQIIDICKQIRNDEKLANGYNALGFSQGAQFLRALAQRCPTPRMNILISFGGQHQGIFGLPKCPSLTYVICDYMRRKLSTAAYEGWMQRDIVQATYWHDPIREADYQKGSTFLSDINNEVTTNNDYIANLNKLKKFVMVKFLNDTIVVPKETQWFGYYEPGQDQKVLPLRDTQLYLKDQLGLKRMDKEGKLIFLETEGDHLRMKSRWFTENIIPFLLEN